MAYESSLTSEPNYTKLIALLDKAEKLASQYEGGYSGEFLSAEEFHQALLASTNALKQGDITQLIKLRTWFSPTSCWDDFIGIAGEDLANEIEALLLILTKR